MAPMVGWMSAYEAEALCCLDWHQLPITLAGRKLIAIKVMPRCRGRIAEPS
jgi:hypothetical protein